tara:strand:- start:4105 stop:4305 length:201 start_codon:yes stop_codon:yes gene_type:complete
MTYLNGVKLRGNETFTELLKIGKKKKRRKKDNSKKGDIFVNCRCCAEYIKGDWRSNSDSRYCKDCL